MKIFILCLSSLSGAATLSRIVLPTLSCRDEGCTPSGSLDKISHTLKRSISTRVPDVTTINAIAKRNSKNVDLILQKNGSNKQQASLPNSQIRSSSPSSDQSKAKSLVETRGANTRVPGPKQPPLQVSSRQGTESANPVQQQIKTPKSKPEEGTGSDVAPSKQSKLTYTTGSRNLQLSSNPNIISSKSSAISSANLNRKQAVQPKLGLDKAIQSVAGPKGSQNGVVSSGKGFQTHMNIAGNIPTGKGGVHALGQQSGKFETSSRPSPGMGKNTQAKATSRSLNAGKKAILGNIAQSGSSRDQFSRRIPNRQGRPSQMQEGKKKLCRRVDDLGPCDVPNETQRRYRAPILQSMEDRRTRKKMEDQLATQASLDLRKAKNSKKSNRLTTGILGTGLASSITSTSATMPGLCCHGMACGSAHLTCAAVGAGSLGAAGICLGCVAVGLTGYKAIQDNKNAKELEKKLNDAYGEVQRQKEGQVSHGRRLSEERVGRQQLAKEVGDAKDQIAQTNKSVGKTLQKLDAVDSTASTALGRTESLERGVADTKKQVMRANKSLQDVRDAAEGAKLDANKASSSYGELKKSHSDRLADHAREIKEVKDAMALASHAMHPLWHNSPHY